MTTTSPSSDRDSRVRVVVATTVLLTFISFWRAAAIVLADLGSTAFYVGGIVEQAVGKSAPWFILGVMIFSYAVRALYIESSAMFVRGGVYRVVKEAMGGTLAKLSVSALLFDYVLTGPISGVSAGAYIVGLGNDLLTRFHVDAQLPAGATAALIAILITIYFWWRNTKGMHESSDDALKIMQVATVMVVILIAWCSVTLVHRGGSLPPPPIPPHLKFSDDALGWLKGTMWPSVTAIAILVGFGHSILAMSGEESLAQVYREIEHPKVKNLQRAGMVIFIYSLVFTALVSFFAVAIIPDSVRPQYYDNLISGLAMNVVGPISLRLVFQALVVIVGFLMLAGAVNTAIVGSNGVLNRVSEDGVLTDWFRKPHKTYGTTYRLINLIVVLQIITILVSRGNVILLGEAYAFGVVWSFAFNALAVTVLRYKLPNIERGWKVPFNFHVGGREVPVGLIIIAISLFSAAVINLFTKETATISGIIFTAAFFIVFVVSERITARQRAAGKGKLDQFQLNTATEVEPESLRCRPGGVLVPVRDYNTLAQLDWAVEHTPIERDVVVLTVRLLRGPDGGAHEFHAEELFTDYEQTLFTKVVAIAERHGRNVKLLALPATNIFDAVAQTAVKLKIAEVVVGESATLSPDDQAHLMGDAWDRAPKDRAVATTFVIFSTSGAPIRFSLGAHPPELLPEDVERIHQLWVRAVKEIGPAVHHRDIVAVALDSLDADIAAGNKALVIERLRRHLEPGSKVRTEPQSQG
ncbi:MAG TPA: amino acid permease [Vicinamibacterales bacterium]|nr:amino acid permease [Vicinamibacterales bacterium]